jgi:hypothetical protein
LLGVGVYRRTHPKTLRVSGALAPTRSGAAGALTVRW